MNQQYDNTNRGVLFRNERKQADTHSDYQGSINVNGQEFYLNAWLKEGAKGKFFSLSIKPKPANQAPAPSTQKRVASNHSTGFDDMDDDIPF